MSDVESARNDLRFAFGRNWRYFVRRKLSDERVGLARDHLLDFLGRKDLRGLDFLDIGCGSGINSAAAMSAGATAICSFDFDPDSVIATELAHKRAGGGANWRVVRGDVLDGDFVSSLGKWSLVYSWGVLHHTGDVWRALEIAAQAVAEGGSFYIALYSADVQSDPEFWLRIKRQYNEASWWKRERMVWWYIWDCMLQRRLRSVPRFLLKMLRYKGIYRGMSLFVDARDWLGGWPMEFTRDADVVQFLRRQGFELKKIKTGEANTEFLFVRTAG